MGAVSRLSMQKVMTLIFFLALTIAPQAQQSENKLDRERSLSRGWSYRYMGPADRAAYQGDNWQKDYRGECVYIGDGLMAIQTRRFGDLLFFNYNGYTTFTPSQHGVRVGSKLQVRCDQTGTLRSVFVIPYQVWVRDL